MEHFLGKFDVLAIDVCTVPFIVFPHYFGGLSILHLHPLKSKITRLEGVEIVFSIHLLFFLLLLATAFDVAE